MPQKRCITLWISLMMLAMMEKQSLATSLPNAVQNVAIPTLSFDALYAWTPQNSLIIDQFTGKPKEVYTLVQWTKGFALPLATFSSCPLSWCVSSKMKWLLWVKGSPNLDQAIAFVVQNLQTDRAVVYPLPQPKVTPAEVANQEVWLPNEREWLWLDSTAQRNVLYRFSVDRPHWVKKLRLSGLPKQVYPRGYRKYTVLGITKDTQLILATLEPKAGSVFDYTRLTVYAINIANGQVLRHRSIAMPPGQNIVHVALAPNSMNLALVTLPDTTHSGASSPILWQLPLWGDQSIKGWWHIALSSIGPSMCSLHWLPGGKKVSFYADRKIWVITMPSSR